MENDNGDQEREKKTRVEITNEVTRNQRSTNLMDRHVPGFSK
jgi:hypothetical protein